MSAKSVMVNSKAYWKLLQSGTSTLEWKVIEYYKIGEIEMVRMRPVLKGNDNGLIN